MLPSKTFRFSTLASLIPVFLGVGLLIVALVQRQRQKRSAARGFAIVGILVLIVLGPMLFRDRVVFDDRGVHQTTGFWFLPTEKGFDLEGVRRIQIETVTVGYGRRRNTEQIWTVFHDSGDRQEIDVGDLWETHAREIVQMLEERGIPVEFR